MATLGDIIRERRELAKLSQEDLAKRVGVSRQAVQQWEANKTGPKRSVVPMLASVLGIPASAIDPISFSSIHQVDTPTEAHTISIVHLENIGDSIRGRHGMPAGLFAFAVGAMAVSAGLRHCFAVEITDDSMAPDYRVGDICIIDPVLKAESGDDVVALLAESAAVLRRMQSRGFDRKGNAVYDLITPSADHVTVTVNSDNPANILGVVVEHRPRCDELSKPLFYPQPQVFLACKQVLR